MIKTIGIARVVGLLLLSVIAIFLVMADTFFLNRGLVAKKEEYAAILNENVNLEEKIQDIQSGMDLFAQYKESFILMQQTQFFDSQNRFAIQPLLESLSDEADLVSLRYEIKPAVKIDSEKAKEVGYQLISTQIAFDLQSLEDTSIYRFLYLLQYGFPGQVTFKSVSLKRVVNVTQPILREIGTTEQREGLVTGRAVIFWQTMIPDDSIAISNGETQEYLEEPVQ